jgi:hypothetical protein
MMQQFLKWLGAKFLAKQDLPEPDLGQTAVGVRPLSERPQTVQQVPAAPKTVRFKAAVSGKIDDGGPGKNVLIRSRLVREDTGTHDTLKILDESLAEAEEQSGIDPYNTGRFDRAKSWEFRSRK